MIRKTVGGDIRADSEQASRAGYDPRDPGHPSRRSDRVSHMQLILVRHALPEDVEFDSGRADPNLTPHGLRQARRLIPALTPLGPKRVFSSPQRRALQTAEPLAEATGVRIQVIGELAEYDHGSPRYIPFHQMQHRAPDDYTRIRSGRLPESVDVDAFRDRVISAMEQAISRSHHPETVAIFCHGGVINVYLQHLLQLERPMTFALDYATYCRVLVSRNGERRVASIHETSHIRDLAL